MKEAENLILRMRMKYRRRDLNTQMEKEEIIKNYEELKEDFSIVLEELERLISKSQIKSTNRCTVVTGLIDGHPADEEINM